MTSLEPNAYIFGTNSLYPISLCITLVIITIIIINIIIIIDGSHYTG